MIEEEVRELRRWAVEQGVELMVDGDKALELADPRPLSDALGFTKPKLPLKKQRRTIPFLADVELDDKGRLMVITSTGSRYRIASDTVVKKIQRLWRAKKK